MRVSGPTSLLRARSGPGLRFAWLWIAAALLVAPACEDEAPTGQDEDAEAAERMAAAAARKAARKAKEEAEAAAAEAPKLEYVYNPVARRDPFRSSLADEVQRTPPPLPLAQYDLDQYKVVAVIWGTDTPVAMVEDPEGNGHFLKVGTIIGRNLGRVSRITEQSVVVAEEYRDFTGQLMVNEIVLNLQDVTEK